MAYGDLSCLYHNFIGWHIYSSQFDYDLNGGTTRHPARLADLAGLRIRSDHWHGYEAWQILSQSAPFPGHWFNLSAFPPGITIHDISNAEYADGISRIGLVYVEADAIRPWHVLAMDYYSPSFTPFPIAVDYVTGEVFTLGATPYESQPVRDTWLARNGFSFGNALFTYDRAQFIYGLKGIGPCPRRLDKYGL